MSADTTLVAKRMDEQYRYQRFVYDLSRKYYLLGRDQILTEIALERGETLLEIGCGTARNLRQLSKHYPNHHLYGLDASQSMLDTGQQKLTPQHNITLQQGFAQNFSPEMFGLNKPFEHLLFSYSLSMILPWKEVLEHAWHQLPQGGQLHIVDFADQGKLPRWFQSMLNTWLDWFNVHPNLAVIDELAYISCTQQAQLDIRYIAKRYAVIAHVTKC